MAGETGTIFDSPWFALERPWFRKIASQSDIALTYMLIVAAAVILAIAVRPNHPALKAVVLAYVILP